MDDVALAEQAARKRLRSLAALDPAVRHRRLYGYLARRGHDAGVIREVVARVLASGLPEESASDERDERVTDGAYDLQ